MFNEHPVSYNMFGARSLSLFFFLLNLLIVGIGFLLHEAVMNMLCNQCCQTIFPLQTFLHSKKRCTKLEQIYKKEVDKIMYKVALK